MNTDPGTEEDVTKPQRPLTVLSNSEAEHLSRLLKLSVYDVLTLAPIRCGIDVSLGRNLFGPYRLKLAVKPLNQEGG